MACMVQSLVAMRVTETVLIGTSEQIVQYSCEGVKMRAIEKCGCSFAVSPCESLLLSNGSSISAVFRLDTPELCEVHRVDTFDGTSWLRPIFSPDASFAVLSSSEKRTVRTIDMDSGQTLCTLRSVEVINGVIYAACFSACSRYLFTASTRSVQQWDARSGALMGRIDAEGTWSVHASTDGCRLVVVGTRGISVLDLAAMNIQVSEQDALQHGPPRPLPLKGTVVQWVCVFVKGRVWGQCWRQARIRVYEGVKQPFLTKKNSYFAIFFDARRTLLAQISPKMSCERIPTCFGHI